MLFVRKPFFNGYYSLYFGVFYVPLRQQFPFLPFFVLQECSTCTNLLESGSTEKAIEL